MARILKSQLKGGFEPQVLDYLKKLRHSKQFKFEYESEVFDYIIKRTYTPDFPVERKDGTKFYIEAKGWFRDADRKKMAAMKEQHPDLDIKFIFMNDGKAGKKQRYSDWCKKHGFDFCIWPNIPEEWFE